MPVAPGVLYHFLSEVCVTRDADKMVGGADNELVSRAGHQVSKGPPCDVRLKKLLRKLVDIIAM
jgi:hypothetical protein